MKCRLIAVVSILLAVPVDASREAGHTSPAVVPALMTPIVDWSHEAQRAIVPPPAGVGDKFPAEAAVYMAIGHAALYDVAVAIHGGYRPDAIALRARTAVPGECAGRLAEGRLALWQPTASRSGTVGTGRRILRPGLSPEVQAAKTPRRS